MKRNLILPVLIALAHSSFSQYWFGPKIGLNYVDPLYQDNAIERDLYDVDNDFDFNAGVALNYTATDLYSVYTEIVYERMNRDLKNKSTLELETLSNAVNDFITVPIMLRVSLGQLPFHYYVNGGPKISYWVSSKGSLYLSSFEEAVVLDPETGAALEPGPVAYKVTFNSSKANGEDVLLLKEPNRLQFGLAVGAGAFFDLATGARLMVDFRYTFGHSNLGFDEPESSFDHPDDFYVESFEYTMNTASISIGYLFGYNSEFQRKGRSTDEKSNKRKKK